MPKDTPKTGFKLLESHELFAAVEDELENRDITESFLKDRPQEAEKVNTALNTLQTVLDQVQVEATAVAEEVQNDDDEDEDDEDED